MKTQHIHLMATHVKRTSIQIKPRRLVMTLALLIVMISPNVHNSMSTRLSAEMSAVYD